MIESEWFQYLTISLAVLLLVSLYFNFKFAKIIKKHHVNQNILIKNAYFNPVTELPNRMNVELVIGEQIDRALRHNQEFLLTAIKITNYHDVKVRSQKLADEFMLEASNRVLDSVRDEDIVSQISDDGFLIVFNEYLQEENYGIIANRIKKAFEDEPHINTKYHIEFNIALGNTKYPNDGTDAALLIDRAVHNALK
ncbi:GGDEF domain-containing protein [Sulfurimonas paralvinellae]|uniref:Diguanylate cyclase n=1 Tax=Sulfurimonas paralvinellae TaxID=317658 RepID=A0A7M1B996_9BACT|nr:diguanylate cyclase [Sulfurimonas paralvinellae]QOP45312.1 diguanylate cyclase [Sulfurimonas paralvinellae]